MDKCEIEGCDMNAARMFRTTTEWGNPYSVKVCHIHGKLFSCPRLRSVRLRTSKLAVIPMHIVNGVIKHMGDDGKTILPAVTFEENLDYAEHMRREFWKYANSWRPA